MSVWSGSDGRCLLHNGRAVEGDPVDMIPFGLEMVMVATRHHGLQIIRVSTLEAVQRIYFDEPMADHRTIRQDRVFTPLPQTHLAQLRLWEEDLIVLRMHSGHVYSLKGAMGRVVCRPQLIAEQVSFLDAQFGVLLLIMADRAEIRGPIDSTVSGHWKDGLILSEGVYLLRDQQGNTHYHGSTEGMASADSAKQTVSAGEVKGSMIRVSWREGLILCEDGLLSNGHSLSHIGHEEGKMATAAIFYHPDHREHSPQCSDELIVGYEDGSCRVMAIAALLHVVPPRMIYHSPFKSDSILNLISTSDPRWGELLIASTVGGKLIVWSLEGRTQPKAFDEKEAEMLRLHVKPFYHAEPVTPGDPLVVLLAHPQAPPHCLLEGADGHIYSIGEDGHTVRLEMYPRMQLRHFPCHAMVNRLGWTTSTLFISQVNGMTEEWDLTQWTLKPKTTSRNDQDGNANGSQYRLINAPGHGHWEPHNVMAWGGTLRLCRYHRNEPWCLNVLLDLRAMVEMHSQLKEAAKRDDIAQRQDNAQAFRDFCLQLIAVLVDAPHPALIKPHENLSLGSLGANRNGSVKLSKHRWAISHTMTASLHLALEILLRMRPLHEDWQPIRHWYACQLPLGWKMRQARRSRVNSLSNKKVMDGEGHQVGKHYCQDTNGDVFGVEEVGKRYCQETSEMFSVVDAVENEYLLPSLSVAAKYWHDQLEEIRRASRAVIQMTLDHFHPNDLHELVDFWSHSLPVALNKHGVSDLMPMNRSAIILAIIAIHHPSYLSSTLQKAVSESLMALLADERRNLFRPAAIELLGMGVSLWESHISLVDVERLLCSWMAGQLAKMEENGGSLSGSYLMSISEEAVCRLLAHAPMTLIPNWLADISRPGRAFPERLLFLRLLDRLSTGYPLALRPFCPAIGDVLIRLLDPNIPNIRYRLLPHFAALLPHLLSLSPWWAWHNPSQRLACGSPDGPIIILDLRSGSRFQVLEGMSHAITSVAFHPDGRYVVAYSATEACIRWWTLATGLLGFLHVAGKPTRSFIVDPPLTEAVLRNELAPVRFHWLNSQTVQITVDGEPITVIPSLVN